ncbi:inositol monophosphatase [Thiohalorhabdus denitrificans]|uniref:Inositol-1-monophosphatase n=1 Tax=Thiohalorhabdus denitrificans TaxID=381306 RepID=A0A0N8PN41_9GAMM|nr:inositol monophosphatase family protein [Thiohalorhabdus denitrificans]KPV40469.1 inositol monophosphatase [Thiohalorhabdus denitrificans]SCY61651.1 myo-inositol-1(or 4)-monophosphatase [Thiohalorhabdus denitrificans]
MHPMLTTAVRAARSAGDLIVRAFDRLDELTVDTKGPHDFVTQVDRAAEETIVNALHKAYPDHAIVGEEGGVHREGSRYRWIIDPLDGTTNFLQGLPHFAVSIALEEDGKLDQAVIYDPVKNDLFVASRGAGAQLNERRIRMPERKGLDGTVLATGFPFKYPELMEAYLDTFRAYVRHTSGIRRWGSAALDLAYTACGRYDGFWEFKLNPWDMAAGALIVREAGGIVTDFEGGDDFFTSGNILAASPRVHRPMLAELKSHVPADQRR